MSSRSKPTAPRAKRAPTPVPAKPAPAKRTPLPPRSAVTARYSAEEIEVLEGLEPVRRRPGMYIGGVDEAALHHLAVELLDNAMDEVLAGAANRVSLEVLSRARIVVSDDGRGIPVEPHPKFPQRSALEVILTTLHAGAKFSETAYETAGGLHGVGLSVVNALASSLEVETIRDGNRYGQHYARGEAQTTLRIIAPAKRGERGTSVALEADPTIFVDGSEFSPRRLYALLRTRAFLFPGVRLYWKVAPDVLTPEEAADIPVEAEFHFPEGISRLVAERAGERPLVEDALFSGEEKSGGVRVAWSLAWLENTADDGECLSFCNSIPTPLGGAHEQGARSGLTQALRDYGQRLGVKRAGEMAADDVMAGCVLALSVFLAQPQFQGQTKERLTSQEAGRAVQTLLRDHLAHRLADSGTRGGRLVELMLERAAARTASREARVQRRSLSPRNTRLPGKLVDCSVQEWRGTEIFLVEGDSAGGSAKQARERRTQAILPLRGKILNAVSASGEKLRGNRELGELMLALGCEGARAEKPLTTLRYERVIIMTDADVDGAHIAALLLSFFCRELPDIIEAGRLYLAQPPLFRLSARGVSAYARDEAEAENLERTLFRGRGGVERSRFKGLGEMMPMQLRETTMDPSKRLLLQVVFDGADTDGTTPKGSEGKRQAEFLMERLLGRRVEPRLKFVQEGAARLRAEALDI